MIVYNKRVNKGDNYYTPYWVTEMLLKYLKLKHTTVVWECASGEGHILRALMNNQVNQYLVASDIEQGEDFLTYKNKCHFDCIITNPPYSIKDQFIEKALSYKKPVALLLPIPVLQGKKRAKIFNSTDLQLELIIPDKRVNFINAPKGVPFASAWFCWGFNIGRAFTFHEVGEVFE